jgi:hypothetical protein
LEPVLVFLIKSMGKSSTAARASIYSLPVEILALCLNASFAPFNLEEIFNSRTVSKSFRAAVGSYLVATNQTTTIPYDR